MEFELLTETLKGVWPMLTIFLVVIISIRIMYIHNSSEKFIFYKEFLNLIFIVYALLLFQLLTDNEMNVNSGYNLVPFTEILRYPVGSSEFTLNVVGNICVFIPFGYFVSRYIKANKVSHILFVTLVTSTTVECVQHYIGRSFDIDDILLNVVGAIIGYLLFVGLNAIEKKLPRFMQGDTFKNIVCLVLLGFAVIYYLKVMGIISWQWG